MSQNGFEKSRISFSYDLKNVYPTMQIPRSYFLWWDLALIKAHNLHKVKFSKVVVVVVVVTVAVVPDVLVVAAVVVTAALAVAV